jgi:galactokinase
MTVNAALQVLDSAEIKKLFAELYGTEPPVFSAAPTDIFAEQKKRCTDLIKQFRNRFGDKDIRIFSSPGRTEIGGNHTDHNHGKVLAAGIQLDCIAVVSAGGDGLIHICDSVYNENYTIDTGAAARPNTEKGSPALVRGFVEGIQKSGFKTGGFCGCFSSAIIPASGLSSSAAFEMLICRIINIFYNGGDIPIEKLARIGQYAENVWWGKASGLLDQMACGFGGLTAIDFENPDSPLVEKIPFDFSAQGYRLIIVNTGGGHAELSEAYSAIPNEMKQVARYFNKDTLRGLSAEDIAKNLPGIRSQCGDRAVMRAFHFIEENIRVEAETAALKSNDFLAFLRHVSASGNSSWKWLQNVYPSNCVKTQNISISLALTEIFLSRHNLQDKAACRIHGGGFAGVIQVFLPAKMTAAYARWMIDALQPACNPVFVMSIRTGLATII